MAIYLTGDTHFGHKLMAERRGYSDIDQMDADLIGRWNCTVDPDAIVYHLGDVSFRNSQATRDILDQLNGTIRLVRGNHDKSIKGSIQERFEWVKDLYTIKEDDMEFVCCHYPLMTWNRAHYGAYHLHGHSHGSLRAPETTRLDVGWDVWAKPLSLSRVVEELNGRQYLTADHHEKKT